MCIYFGRFSHCTGLDCQEVKNSGDKQSVNWSLLGWQGSAESGIVPPGPGELHFIPLEVSFESPLAASVGCSPEICTSCPSFPARPVSSSGLFSAAYVKPASLGWPHASHMLFITRNLYFHDTSCSSWSLCHYNKGIMKYMYIYMGGCSVCRSVCGLLL